MMTRESILQEIIEVATEALNSTKPISDDLNLLVKFLYKKEVRVKRVYRIKKDTEEKVLVGYLGDATLDKVRDMIPDINEEEYYPTWYYEYSVNPGKLVEFIPEHLQLIKQRRRKKK